MPSVYGLRTSVQGRSSSRFLPVTGYMMILIISFFIGTTLLPDTVTGTDNGYRFNSNSLTVGDCTTDYGLATTMAAYDYDNNTDLNVISVSGCNGVVNVVQGSYQNVTWHALALPYNAQGQPCSNFNDGTLTPYCNTVDKKVAFAVIYYNNLRGIYSPLDAQQVARHELGHVFGMGHTVCGFASVMMDFESCGVPANSYVLRSYDLALINGWY